MIEEKFIDENSLDYQIVVMRLKEDRSYREIASFFNMSMLSIKQHYRKFCWNLYKCYSQHLKDIGKDIDEIDIRNFYESYSHAIAYLEKTYEEPLSIFRGGHPPIFLEGIKNLPPYKKLTDRQLCNLEKKIVDAREYKGKTFADIGKELKLTTEKVRWMYDHYYHKKVLAAIKKINPDHYFKLSNYIFAYSNYSHKRWEMITQNYPELIQDPLDK